MMTNQPALKTALLLSIGILVAHVTEASFHCLLLTTLLLTTFSFILYFSGKRIGLLQITAAVSILFLGGLRYAQISTLFPDGHILRHMNSGRFVTLQGFLTKDPVEKPGRIEVTIASTSMTMDTLCIPVCGKVRTTVYDSLQEELHYGDEIRLSGKLVRPRGRRNPGGFDYRAFLARQDIHVLLRLDRHSQIVKTGHQRGGFLLRDIVYPARRFAVRIIDRTTTGDARAMLRALIVGEKGTLDNEIRDQFAKAGIIHILAVSGLHVGFVLLFLTIFLDLLRLPFSWKTLLLILGIIFYVMLTEAKPPVIRAGIMATVYLIGTLLEKRTNPLNLVGVAALVILLWKPRDLFDVGFQLSFSAILSIVIFYQKLMMIPSIRTFYEKVSRSTLARYLLPLLLVSVAAQLGTLPLTAVYFNRVPLLSIVVNLLAIPAAGLIVALGFVTILAGLLHPWLAAVYGALNQEILSLLVRIVTWVGDRPFAFITVPTPGVLRILLYFAIILGIIHIHRKDMRKRFAFFALICLNILVWTAVVKNDSSKLTWLQFDVGQGDAAILHLPRNRHILIDGGDKNPYFDNGERVIAPYLCRKGIRQLDAVILSHPHNDHVGGLEYILKNFGIGQVITAETVFESPLYAEFLRTIQERNIPLRVITAPDSLTSFPGIKGYFLSPTEMTKQNASSSVNNQSLVVRILYGGTAFLFTGDAEKEAEGEMLDSKITLSSNVLKAGHHGSSTSSSMPFLKAVSPEAAIISVGQNNRFRHPSSRVLNRFGMMDITIHRTDEEGAILLKSDGNTVKCVSWK